jgi:hypothetical protein
MTPIVCRPIVVIVSIMELWPIAIQESYSANESAICGSRRDCRRRSLPNWQNCTETTSVRSNGSEERRSDQYREACSRSVGEAL